MTNRATLRERAALAAKNYGRAGSSWALFYGRDVPDLLDTLEAVEKLGDELWEHHVVEPGHESTVCMRCRFLAILEGGKP